MQNLTTEQKASAYNNLLHQYQRLQEEVRLIRAQSVNISESDERKIVEIERRMKMIYNETEKLYR
jgi:hydroxymethylglutaryl-CoA reductase